MSTVTLVRRNRIGPVHAASSGLDPMSLCGLPKGRRGWVIIQPPPLRICDLTQITCELCRDAALQLPVGVAS